MPCQLFSAAPSEIQQAIYDYLSFGNRSAVSVADSAALAEARQRKFWEEKLALHFPDAFMALTRQANIDGYAAFGRAYNLAYMGLHPEAKKLFSALKENHLTALSQYASHVNAVMHNGKTPAHLAVERGQVEA
jgi:hypothetical protein